MKRAPALQKFIDEMATQMFGWDGDVANCRMCNNPVEGFKDGLSQREYEISGMCQQCQDDFFGGEHD